MGEPKKAKPRPEPVLELEQMVSAIRKQSRLSRKEIMERIREKREELSGFVTPEGAAHIVARDLGIIFEREKPRVRTLRIGDLTPEVPKVNLVGKVAKVYGPRVFKRMDKKPGLVGSLLLRDGTGQIKLVLWGDKTSLIKEGKVRKGDIVRIRNAYVRQGPKELELNLGVRSSISVKPGENWREGRRAKKSRNI